MQRLILFRWLGLCLGLCLLVAAAAQAGQNVTGTVRNGADGKPASGVTVTLLALKGGMQPVGTMLTDAAGRYRFSQAPAAANQYLVQADFQGVPYFAQVAIGQSETNLEVFPASADESKIKLGVEVMVLQPTGGQLAVVNEYRIENDFTPKTTLNRPGGLFRFQVPTGVAVNGARVIGPDGLPVERIPTPTGTPNMYRLETPLRPGESRIQVSYRIPYTNANATIHEQPLYPTTHFEVYVPEPMEFNGIGFTQVGEEPVGGRNFRVYGVPDNATTDLKFSISGNAPMPADAQGTESGAAAPAPLATNAAPPAPSASSEIPEKTWLERNVWTVLALLVLAAAGGFGWMYTQPAAAGAPSASAAPENNLSRLKDDLFLLEVRKHTGNIGEAEYERQRAELARRMDQLAGRG